MAKIPFSMASGRRDFMDHMDIRILALLACLILVCLHSLLDGKSASPASPFPFLFFTTLLVDDSSRP